MFSKIVPIHSFRGGTGKSYTTANLAALLAARGPRVGVMDTDLYSPGIHVPLGLDLERPEPLRTLNDYPLRKLLRRRPLGRRS